MVGMTEPSPLPVRVIEDVETLKALADPVRLAILRVLMEGARETPRIRSVKELAAELGEPQTKLYRHVKQLEARGLIQLAETRLVSGIVEHRYRAGQWSLDMEADFFRPGALGIDEAAEAFATILDNYRNELVADIRAGRIWFDRETPPGESYRKVVSVMTSARISAARASEFRDRMAELINEIVEAEHAPDGVPINVLASFYSPQESE
jgi:DNA-binding transcriptional ArsR family regulator